MKRYLITGPAPAVRALCDTIEETREDWLVAIDEGTSPRLLIESFRAFDHIQNEHPHCIVALAFPGVEPAAEVAEAFGGERWEVKRPIRPTIWRVLADSPTGKTFATHNGDTWAEALESAVAA